VSGGGVVVTGASSGIGRACVLDLDWRGFRVFAGVRKEEDAEALRRDASARLMPVMIDVTDPAAIAALRETVDRELGAEPLRGLVNNAGVGTGGPLEALDVDELRTTLEINTVAPVAIAQQLIPRLRESRGRVINITSIGGRIAQPFLGPYSASKFALEALTDTMRRELLPWGIHVAAIEPGNVKTRIWEKGGQSVDAAREAMTDEQRRLYGANLDRMERLIGFADRNGTKPEKVARVVAHALTSERPRARYLVGADARVQLAIDRLLPTRVVDRLMARLGGS
jgi:NAD(P)-dependent dehydrogenase (short-subunit alcohol dehydrogenase family)